MSRRHAIRKKHWRSISAALSRRRLIDDISLHRQQKTSARYFSALVLLHSAWPTGYPLRRVPQFGQKAAATGIWNRQFGQNFMPAGACTGAAAVGASVVIGTFWACTTPLGGSIKTSDWACFSSSSFSVILDCSASIAL